MANHCRHCLGNCGGNCLLSNGMCIHNPMPPMPTRKWTLLIRSRRFWRRVFWGVD